MGRSFPSAVSQLVQPPPGHEEGHRRDDKRENQGRSRSEVGLKQGIDNPPDQHGHQGGPYVRHWLTPRPARALRRSIHSSFVLCTKSRQFSHRVESTERRGRAAFQSGILVRTGQRCRLPRTLGPDGQGIDVTPRKGTRLSQYSLEEKIGAGGMGEVWKAVDTTLDRSVAVKLLPEAFSDDAHRLARFEREAKILASLNHPNIAMVHGLHSADGIHFLAMELVGGEDLSQRLQRGPLPIEEAMAIAHQVAEALEAAHDSGVVHRDLNAANIQVTREGKVTVLDFGLAKAFDQEPGSGQVSASISPTMTAAASLAGVILGTAAYMSPEQARGRAVDRRADIWAFGCVLYEMLAGKRLFEGETISDTLAAVLRSEPDWAALPAATPPTIRALLRWCLEKDPKKRLQAIGDARIAIDGMLPVQEGPAPGPGKDGSAARLRERLAWSLAAILAVASVASLLMNRPAPAPAGIETRALVEPPDGTRFDFAAERSGSLSLSPDGRQITFSVHSPTGDTSLWIRPVDSFEGHALPGTKSAMWPFWSPDGRYIGFFAEGKMKRIDLAGSPPIAICDAKDGRGGSWSRDGIILFAPNPNSGIFSVPVA